MPRYSNNVAIMAKVEATAGVENAPSAATDGLLLTGKPDVTPLDITSAQRDLLMPYFGGSQDLVALVSSKVSFSVELAGSGAAGVAAAWSTLLQGCATAQALLASPSRVEHTPVSTGFKTLTIYINDDGVQHKLTGAIGNCKISAKKGETPKLMFEFIGAYSAPSVVAMPNVTLSQWKVPVPMTKANVVDITLGCTYSAGALSGGTSFGSNGLELDFGNDVGFFSTLSSERGEVKGRKSTASFELELTAAQEVTAIADMYANTTTGMGFTIGSAAGAKLVIFAPNMQRTNTKKVDSDGVRMIGFDCKLIPVNGNDEIRLVQL